MTKMLLKHQAMPICDTETANSKRYAHSNVFPVLILVLQE